MLSLLLYRLKRPYHFFKTGVLRGLPAQIKYGFPQSKLKVILISGTDGKTTTATLLHHILTTSAVKTGLITTVSAKIGQKIIDTGLHVTAPEPQDLYSVLRQMVDAGCSHVVIEMTSHGAYQYRNWGIRAWLGGITNITHEHFDYHVNYHEYAEAKLQQFKSAQKVFFPEGDRSSTVARKKLKSVLLTMYSKKTKISKLVSKAISSRFPENYNQQNALLATLLAKEVGIPDTTIATAITSFEGVPGRMEQIVTTKGYSTFIDFAHTPNAVESILTHLKRQTRGKLIVVLGCAGLRDTSKRPLMGFAAAKLADIVVFTAEDPRTENIWTIINQMKSRLQNLHHKVISISDRGTAIHFAMTRLANRGDTVAILGKGHESSMCFDTHEYAWSDRAAVEQIATTGTIPTLGKQIM